MSATDYALGLTYPPTLLSAFSTPIPQPSPALYTPFTRVAGQNGAGVPVTVGFPTLVWNWDWLLQTWYNEILALLAGETSAFVYVGTKLDDGTWKYFRAVMWYPVSSPVIGSRRGNVQLRFTNLDTLPAFASAVVEDAADTTVKVTFNQNIIATNYATGVTIKVNTVAATISSATRQTNHNEVWFVLSAAVTVGQVVTWEYSKASGNYESDPLLTPMEDVAASAVTNSVV